MVVVVDDDGRLLDRSPRAIKDPELGALPLGERVVLLADTKQRVHAGSSRRALWFSRGDSKITGGLTEGDCGAMLERLRNLLGILIASLDTEDMVGAGPVSRKVGDTRRREVDRIVDVLGHLEHTFAGIELATEVDLDLLLRRAIDQLRGHARSRGIELRLEADGDGKRLCTGDESSLGGAMQALLANAIEASGPEGAVSIRIGRSAAATTIAIEDDGPGLLSGNERPLGTAFSTGKRGHVGLGLALARRAAFVHGGELSVSTRPKGTGVIARLWLPIG